MRQTVRRLALAGAITSAAVLPATAQSSYNVAAGLTVASGDFGDRNEAGYNLIAGIGFMQAASPIGIRIEGLYNSFNQKGLSNSASHAGGVTLNGVYDITPGGSKTAPSFYGIGGFGYYSTREPFLQPESQGNWGWNVGGGVRFPLGTMSAYVEARYHNISDANVSFIPISFGLSFK